jgi:hypothetical protein
MTDLNYTHLLLVVDRSGSMTVIRDDMVGGIDELFSEQAKVEGKCLVDYVQFDTVHETVLEDTPVADAKAKLDPRGGTALFDAVGRATVALGEKLNALPEHARPGLVQVVVVTDGYENSSREWTGDAVRKLIKEQEEKYSWDYVFLGANMDAVETGSSYGFSGTKSLTYTNDTVYAAAASTSGYVTRSRLATAAGASAGSNAFTDDERENA